MATNLEAPHSRSISHQQEKQEDCRSNSDIASDQSASVSPQPDEMAVETTADVSTIVVTTEDTIMVADTTEEMTAAGDIPGDRSTATIRSRCVVNFLDPQPGKCDSNITNDDRHYISNFFGRNKACSTSIPDEFYHVLCRKCMQAMRYRVDRGQHTSELQVQVAAIKHVLRNMAASGKWVLLEVQLTKSEHERRQDPAKYDADIKKFNDEVEKCRREARATGEKKKRRNTKKGVTPVPEWLAELVVDRNVNRETDKQYFPTHERRPTPWTFEDIIDLVDLIGEKCEVLPNIECLPITQGELDKTELQIAQNYHNIAAEDCERLGSDIAELKAQLESDPEDETLQANLKDFQDRQAEVERQIQDAQEELKKAEKKWEASKHTLPAKRVQTRKAGCKGDSSKTGAKKGKGKKGQSSTQIEPEPTEGRSESPADQAMIDILDSVAVDQSPSPPPGWKGKGKAIPPLSPLSLQDKSLHRRQPSTGTTSPRPSTPPATAPRTSHRLSSFSPAAQAPITPNQPILGMPHAPTSTTRSEGRRWLRAAELARQQPPPPPPPQAQQGQQGPQLPTQARGVKRRAGKEATAPATIADTEPEHPAQKRLRWQ